MTTPTIDDRIAASLRVAELHFIRCTNFSSFNPSYVSLFSQLWHEIDPAGAGCIVEMAKAEYFAGKMVASGWVDWEPTARERDIWRGLLSVQGYITVEQFAELSENPNFSTIFPSDVHQAQLRMTTPSQPTGPSSQGLQTPTPSQPPPQPQSFNTFVSPVTDNQRIVFQYLDTPGNTFTVTLSIDANTRGFHYLPFYPAQVSVGYGTELQNVPVSGDAFAALEAKVKRLMGSGKMKMNTPVRCKGDGIIKIFESDEVGSLRNICISYGSATELLKEFESFLRNAFQALLGMASIPSLKGF